MINKHSSKVCTDSTDEILMLPAGIGGYPFSLFDNDPSFLFPAAPAIPRDGRVTI